MFEPLTTIALPGLSIETGLLTRTLPASSG
jgi:hypothetical protein